MLRLLVSALLAFTCGCGCREFIPPPIKQTYADPEEARQYKERIQRSIESSKDENRER